MDIKDFDEVYDLAAAMRKRNSDLDYADSLRVAAQLYHTQCMVDMLGSLPEITETINAVANELDVLVNQLIELRTTISYKS